MFGAAQQKTASGFREARDCAADDGASVAEIAGVKFSASVSPGLASLESS